MRITFLTLVMTLFFVGCSGSAPEVAGKSDADKLWGSERVCLPCHLMQQPIARRHNYRCDTCHRGNPWAEDKDEAHYDLIRNPQAAQNIDLSCNKCHMRLFGKEAPYNPDFIRDVIVSHKRKPGEDLEWSE